MRWFWLLVSIACALMAGLFCYTLVYYFMHYSPTWRVVGLFAAIAVWVMLTRGAFSKFSHRTPN
jgi:hypothetical protein